MSIDPNTFEKGLDYRIRYSHLINQCVNYELKRNYGVMGYSRVEYCVTNENEARSYDSLEIICLMILFIIFALNVTSTVYNYEIDASTECSSKFKSYFASFSITRNWNKLIAKPTSDLSKDLNFIHSLRFLTMYGVIVGHSILFYNIFPISNPEFVEEVN